MERLACVNIPHLALQVLLRDNPDWRKTPVVLVDKNTPQGIVLQCNKAASVFAIRQGMRFATARSLCEKINAGVVTPSMIKKTVKNFHADLFEFCPEIDLGSFSSLVPMGDDFRFSGTAWLRVTGLDALFGSYEKWAKKLYAHLRVSGLTPSISIGFSRFGSYVLAKNKKTGITIPDSDSESRKLVYKSGLRILELEPKAVAKLERLGIKNLVELLRLPPESIQKRFGREAFALWKESSDLKTQMLKPIHYEAPLEETVTFEDAEWDATRLLFSIKASLHRLCLRLRIRSHDLKKITLKFKQENGDEKKEEFRPATPSNDETRWIALIRLRLDRMKLHAAICEIKMVGEGVPYFREQLNLLHDVAKRDLHTTQHALEELRAAFGPSIVKKAIVEDEHLPEKKFNFVEIESLPRPKIEKESCHKIACRRIYKDPNPLPHFDSELPNYITIRSIDEGGVKKYSGPFSVSGAWWESWFYRDYYFAETHRGDVYWLYFDHRVRQLYHQGHIE